MERLIHDHLRSVIPDIALVGEQTFDAQEAHGGQGLFRDPIDAIENFCLGLKTWGVSFTLWHAGVHLGSLLYTLELGEHLMTGDTLRPVLSRIRGFSLSMCPRSSGAWRTPTKAA